MAPQPGLEPETNADLITAQSVALHSNIETKILNLAPQPGLEPGTNGLTVRCSTN